MAFYDSYKHTEDTHTGGITGDFRCVIKSAEETVSKSGKNMFKIGLIPSGQRFTVYEHITEGEYFNEKISRFFDAFPSIGDGNFQCASWIGAEGAAHFAPDDKGYTKVKWFIVANKADRLPVFEGEKPVQQEVSTLTDVGDEVDIPF